MILAAGYGTRLRPLTNSVPKCLVPLQGRPILEHTIEWLVSHDIADIIINVSHLAQVVMDHIGDGARWGAKIRYSIENQPLGTAGGVKNASWFFDGPFLVWYGDNYSRCNLGSLQEFHRRRNALTTMCLHHREDVSQSGIVELDSEGMVIRFLEKPNVDEVFSRWVNAGVYVCEPEILEYIPAEGSPDFGRDVFPAVLRSGGRIAGYRLSNTEGLTWVDRPEDLSLASQIGVIP